ncbi:MAG: hypothetical protein KAS23_11710 [Anaerohalosphaera sp.]|nr:hypothetical protein [Anaerohalosphaera sp.]
MLANNKLTNRRTNGYCANAFTIIEVIVATIVIALAIVALIGGNRAFSQTNGEALKMSNAEFLIGQVREMTLTIPVLDPETDDDVFGVESGESTVADYDDLDDFDAETFSPPLDIYRNAITDMSAYSQRIIVQNVNANDFSSIIADHGSDFVRVTVEILLNGNVVTSENWIRAGL